MRQFIVCVASFSLLLFLGITIASCGGMTATPAPSTPVVTQEDIRKLCQAAVERGRMPTGEGHIYLEFRSGGLRQYVTLTLAPHLFAGFVPCVGVEELDFIQEQWQVNVLDQDQIEQWVVAAHGNGLVGKLWHRRLVEDKGAVLQEEFLAADENTAKAIVKNILARFLTPLLSATAIVSQGHDVLPSRIIPPSYFGLSAGLANLRPLGPCTGNSAKP